MHILKIINIHFDVMNPLLQCETVYSANTVGHGNNQFYINGVVTEIRSTLILQVKFMEAHLLPGSAASLQTQLLPTIPLSSCQS